jgi:hypothetical protein
MAVLSSARHPHIVQARPAAPRPTARAAPSAARPAHAPAAFCRACAARSARSPRPSPAPLSRPPGVCVHDQHGGARRRTGRVGGPRGHARTAHAVPRTLPNVGPLRPRVGGKGGGPGGGGRAPSPPRGDGHRGHAPASRPTHLAPLPCVGLTLCASLACRALLHPGRRRQGRRPAGAVAAPDGPRRGGARRGLQRHRHGGAGVHEGRRAGGLLNVWGATLRF